MQEHSYDVVIIGAGVTGTALVYLLSKYTNIGRIALLEKYGQLASVSSRVSNNSQTLHVGDIETHYTPAKVLEVKRRSGLVARYVEAYGEEGVTHKQMQRMVLAVGQQEVADLEAHYETIKHLFPGMQKIGGEELSRLEPKVMEGRAPGEPVLALYTERGYVMNFGKLAESFVEQARALRGSCFDLRLNTPVRRITKTAEGYDVETPEGTLQARMVVVATGAYSLSMAHALGYGTELTIIPVAGNFYEARNVLRGKVYTMQIQGLPFAAIHADPDVVQADTMRFGPIPMAVPLLEPRKWRTCKDFVKQFSFDWDTLASIVRINTDPQLVAFLFKSFVYGLPVIGKWFFVRDVHKIIPSMRATDLVYGHELGGIRPQIVDKKARKILLGVAKIPGDGIIFNVTPSPGASVCLASGEEDVHAIIKHLGGDYTFDTAAFERDLG